jgi:hypothetical protein
MEMSISLSNLKQSQLVEFEIIEWKNPIKGLYIYQGSEWIIVHGNPVDYQVDGFYLIFKSHIKKIRRSKKDIFRNKVILSCDKINNPRLNLDIDGTVEILRQIGFSYEIIAIQSEFETSLCVGIIEKITDSEIFFREIDTKGEIIGNKSAVLASIRLIEFDTDYLTSLLSYNRKGLRQNVSDVQER